MLPPVDEQTIRDNPEFAKLYRMLLEKALNPDGSTKHDNSIPEGDAVQQGLHQARIDCAETHLLEWAISTVSLPEPTSKLPSEEAISATGLRVKPAEHPLADILALLPSLINQDNDQCIDPDDAATALSCPPLSELESHISEVCALVSETLHTAAIDVARVAHPSTNPSYLHRHIPSLPNDFAALAAELSEATSALTKNRLEALVSLTKLLQSYTQMLALLVRTLESKHGSASRRLELQALNVSQDVQLTEAGAKVALITTSKDMYSPETISALANYSSHLKDAQMRAAERVRGLQEELADYGVGDKSERDKEKTMREMARIHREMESQMEDVKKDLARLQQRL
ncbi:hypothetical protein E4U19_003699 [Claviceps sp. Clav32 group G5]|nr:hypothetical protein E4U19_003699 [Claviceps sp. Clav32 group G5]KAG6044220.1 hypothetical protein E4U39_003590 [Claviceps sp. Clav50 group G5]